ncbi:MAG: GbsR/MarR family transcriptional regulator [Candidatus Nanosalina sp.]
MTEPGPREKVIQAMEDAAELYNFNPSYARLYGVLYFSGEEMTLDELAEETGFSKSTVSRGMNRLEELYLVESRKREGEGKTKFYSAEEDLEHAFMEIIRNEASREIEIMTDALEEAEEEMKQQGDEEGLERVRNLKNFYSRSEKLIKIMKKIPSGQPLEKLLSSIRDTLDYKR